MHECKVPKVKYRSSVSVMIQGSISARSVGEITFINGTMNICGYTQIMTEGVTSTLEKPGKGGFLNAWTVSLLDAY